MRLCGTSSMSLTASSLGEAGPPGDVLRDLAIQQRHAQALGDPRSDHASSRPVEGGYRHHGAVWRQLAATPGRIHGHRAKPPFPPGLPQGYPATPQTLDAIGVYSRAPLLRPAP
jgi:hypothetical protein